MNWKSAIAYIAARLSEKSTRTAIVGLITAAVGHTVLAPDLALQIDSAVAAVCAVLVILFKEKTPGAGGPPSSVAALLFVLAVLTVMAGGVSACSFDAPPSTTAPSADAATQNAKDITDKITVVYGFVKTTAVACTTKVVCDDASAAIVAKALPDADAAVANAIARINAHATDGSNLTTYSGDAMAAIQTLLQVLATLGVKV